MSTIILNGQIVLFNVSGRQSERDKLLRLSNRQALVHSPKGQNIRGIQGREQITRMALIQRQWGRITEKMMWPLHTSAHILLSRIPPWKLLNNILHRFCTQRSPYPFLIWNCSVSSVVGKLGEREMSAQRWVRQCGRHPPWPQPAWQKRKQILHQFGVCGSTASQINM